jgi:hypothetical protein
MPKYATQAEYDELLQQKYRIFVGECWDYLGCTDKDDYGIVQQFGKAHKAHRKMYEIFKGKIPKGAQIHHTCERKICGNPDHLVAKTPKAHNAEHYEAPTHCPKGHEYTPENTEIRKSGSRRCRKCSRDAALAYYHSHKSLKGGR